MVKPSSETSMPAPRPEMTDRGSLSTAGGTASDAQVPLGENEWATAEVSGSVLALSQAFYLFTANGSPISHHRLSLCVQKNF